MLRHVQGITQSQQRKQNNSRPLQHGVLCPKIFAQHHIRASLCQNITYYGLTDLALAEYLLLLINV